MLKRILLELLYKSVSKRRGRPNRQYLLCEIFWHFISAARSGIHEDMPPITTTVISITYRVKIIIFLQSFKPHSVLANSAH